MNVIIVHGSPRSEERAKETPQNKAHWIFWLKESLEEKGHEVFNPLMPTPWKPKYNEWKKEFEKIPVNGETILIGYSAGGSFLVRWLGDTKKKIRKLILVAPAKIYVGESGRLKDFCNFEIDKTISERIKKTVIFISNDKEMIIKDANIYQKKLSGKLIKLKKRGHFTLGDMGTEEFPELLKEVLKAK